MNQDKSTDTGDKDTADARDAESQDSEDQGSKDKEGQQDNGDSSDSGGEGAGDDTGDNDDAVGEDGLTADEREELTSLRERHKSASDKISADGEEKARMRTALEAAGIDWEKESGLETPPTAGDAADGAGTGDDEENPYAGINTEGMSQAELELIATQHQYFADKNEKLERELAETRNLIETDKREREEAGRRDTQYNHYSSTTGMDRDTFDAMMRARETGDHIEADKIRDIQQKAHGNKSRQSAQQARDALRSQTADAGGVVQDSEMMESKPADLVNEEVSRIKALPDIEQSQAVLEIYGKYPDSVARRIADGLVGE